MFVQWTERNIAIDMGSMNIGENLQKAIIMRIVFIAFI